MNRDRAHYAGALYALDTDGARIRYAAGDGVLIRANWISYVSAETDPAAEDILDRLETDAVVSYDRRFDAPLSARGFTREMRCHSCLYEKAEPPQLALPLGVEMRLLTPDYAAFIYAHYSHSDGRPDYVSERVRAGMIGLFDGGALAGFIGTHDTGEMGLLEVLPEYRRRGLARLLEARMIGERLLAGRLPYGDVETNNEASLSLQRSLGMSVSDRDTCWYFR